MVPGYWYLDTSKSLVYKKMISLKDMWFIAVVAFLMAAFGLATDRQWWRAVTIGAIILSQILIWWPDAKWGTMVNVLIIIGGTVNERIISSRAARTI